MTAIAHAWKPIEAPADPAALAVPALRGYAQIWEGQRSHLRLVQADERFLERLRRSWAIETGVIERLYDLSEGATHLLVQQGFDAALIGHGESTMEPAELIEMLQDHREALDFAMDVVGGPRPLSVSWIKELHALITRHQWTAKGKTPDGRWTEIPLRRGEFKRLPNNPWSDSEGGVHEYCPPEQVDSEMDRLITLYGSLPDTLPEVRAAWLHHAFVQIHPFQDGNGRVARVLASLDFIKSGLFPVLVKRGDKARYMGRLRQADAGDLGSLVDLFAELQERVLRQAIDDAEAVAHDNLGSVLTVARAKRDARLHSRPEQRMLLIQRMNPLGQTLHKVLHDQAKRIADALPDVAVEAQEIQLSHHPLVPQLGDEPIHQIDAGEPARWVELKLTERATTRLVITLQVMNSPATDVLSAFAFVTHEAPDAQRRMREAVEPLLLTLAETLAQQQQRFEDWLEQAIVKGLAIWTKFL